MQYTIQSERLRTNLTNTNHFEEKEEGREEDDSVGGGDGYGWGVTGLATGRWTHRYYGLCKHTFTQCNDHYSNHNFTISAILYGQFNLILNIIY